MRLKHFALSLIAATSFLFGASSWLYAGTPLGASFIYQGELTQAGTPIDGTVDLVFHLFDVETGGAALATLPKPAHEIVAGKLTIDLDFGAGAFDGDERWLEVEVDGATLAPRQRIAAAPYSLQTRGLFCDVSYRIGIGTNTPVAKLDIQGADNSNVLFGRRTGGGLAHNLYIDGSGNGSMQLIDGTGTPRVEFANGLNYFRTGNVGIGTTAPAMPLHIARDPDPVLILQDTGSPNQQVGYIGFWNNTGGETAWFGYGTPGSTALSVVNKRSNGPIHFYTNNTLRMALSFDGNLGVGTTNPIGLIHATSSTHAWTGKFFNSRQAGIAVDGRTNSQFAVSVYGQSLGPDSYDFFASGTGVHYGQSSSIRWKHNIEPIADPLSRIDQIRGVYFDWDAEHGGHHDVGMIAEEVGRVLPEIVNYEPNGIDAHGMDYSKLTPLLVEAVKALRAEKDAQIEELQVENSALRDRLDAMESTLAKLLAASSQGTEQ